MPPAASTTAKKTPSLKLLTVRLKEIQTNFNDIWEFVEEFTDDIVASEVIVRLGMIDDLWERFGDTLIEIKSHDDFNIAENVYEKERKEFSIRYYKAKSFLMDKAKEKQEPSALEHSIRAGDMSMQSNLDHVRLPQIKLQTFNGNIDEWLSFRDLFTSLIHLRGDLPEVEKLHYLKGCLQGEPKALIDPLQITRANYLVAWEMLQKRYNNSKQLKKRQILSLFKLPTLNRESVAELQTLLEGFERIIQTLDQIVEQGDYKDLLLVNLLTARLDPVTRRGWEEFSSTKDQDSLSDLTEFLQRRIRILEALPSRSAEFKGPHQNQQPPRQKAPMVRNSYNTSQSTVTRCVACAANHLLYQCDNFRRMSVSEKETLLRSYHLCRNCLTQGHNATECPSKYSCRKCKGRHHTMVCFKPNRDVNPKPNTVAHSSHPSISRESIPSTSSSAEEPTPSTSSHVVNMAATEVQVSGPTTQYSSQILLATAVIVVEDDHGNRYPARALLDSGSESNFITERLSQRLKAVRERVDIAVLGIGQAENKVKQRIRAIVRSRVSEFSREMSFLVLPKVTVNLPSTSIIRTGWAIPPEVELADPSFCVSTGVDIILGIEAFFDYFEPGRRISLGEHLPTLNESVFGWVVCGGLTIPNQSLLISCNAASTENLDALLVRFWSCEEVGSDRAYSPEEARCEAQFTRTVQRDTDGRYIVSLPKDEGTILRLGDSRTIALRRLQGTERRLAKDADLRQQYGQFMEEYLQLGHMRKVEERDQVYRCYLPHHPVVKEASTTTKVRVVFDASCKTSSGVSLNDTLLVGPVVQEDLRSIILRSRIKQIMLVADVEKMFRQINIREEDKPLQSILWRSSPGEEVVTYELNTVTYGTKPAPFLATRTLKQLATDEGERFPLAAQAVNNDTYMDDVITGTDNAEEALTLRIQLEGIMTSGGFRLRKWASNCPEALDGVLEENLAIREAGEIDLDPDPSVKTLGLTWMPHTDTVKFQFNVPPVDSSVVLTKRRVLSIIAMLFDPLGLLGAAITTAKIFMQLLWTLRDEFDQRLAWDQQLPSTVGEKWRRYHQQLPLFNQIRIDRCVVIADATLVQIHCFSDASEKAYGGCLYVRSQDSQGRVKVVLLTSKSKVAPFKCQSIPRLELCGALLTSLLYEKVAQAIRIPARTWFWTDSTCVLRWIKAVPTTWTTFVANRVAKIQNLTEGCQWRHVPGLQNPADLISRGISPEEITESTFWWQGPRWLKEGPEQWPNTLETPAEAQEDEERRRTTAVGTASAVQEFTNWYITKFGSYTDLIRKTAIWLRLIKLRFKATKEDFGFLTTVELKDAENVLIRRVQKETFADDWKALSKGEEVPRKSPLRWYNPYISVEQVIRVGGRLKHSMEPEDTKHPVVLPAWHKLTRKILEHYHLRLLHAGPQLLLSTVRLRFWPLGGRNVARHIVHKCHKCYRQKPSPVQQFMGDLPEARVTISRPFTKAGVDYFGPVWIRPGPRRTAVKGYVAVFICLCTKAVHLELVSDLSTNRFLQALRRFIARRGKCSDLYSDNGTNFIGARNLMLEFLGLLKDKRHNGQIAKMCSGEGIQWHFIPPGAPHFGGLWEAAVRSTKHHLLRVIGDNPTSIEDFTTLLVQVEGCLNSRPITPMSDDPNDLEPLTPAHFLVGSSLECFPEPNQQAVPINRLNHWQLVQRKLQDFWQRWRREYLCQLQGRTKRWRPPVQIEIGRLVVLCNENLPPARWKLGRIHELHPGVDGVVRVVTLKTATGFLRRPVEKICLLPLSTDHSEQDETTKPNQS